MGAPVGVLWQRLAELLIRSANRVTRRRSMKTVVMAAHGTAVWLQGLREAPGRG